MGVSSLIRTYYRFRELTHCGRHHQRSSLEDPAEEKPAGRGVTAVETEDEFIKVRPPVLRAEGGVESAEEHPLEQREDTVDVGENLRGLFR